MLLDAERDRIREQLVADEGLRLHPYRDTVGKLTIGVGRNLTDVGISAAESYFLLDNDIDRSIVSLVSHVPWFMDLDPVRATVLTQLEFNMGHDTLAGFVHMLDAVKRHDWPEAAKGLRESRWFTQVQPSRSGRLLRMLLTGEWPA